MQPKKSFFTLGNPCKVGSFRMQEQLNFNALGHQREMD